ncbi:hypothetical protein DFP72DRAFT_1106917 [Ephemerocybe angulata]|uniref:Uncharacterized protein n=1 Tax=Ephemerocybe angulata TaxID=980116 RepID=A0A8H6I6Q6_9AGAR|nr:hypothetical protein DFP72DRAFT_1106917 [Tulosesus angulatus]
MPRRKQTTDDRESEIDLHDLRGSMLKEVVETVHALLAAVEHLPFDGKLAAIKAGISSTEGDLATTTGNRDAAKAVKRPYKSYSKRLEMLTRRLSAQHEALQHLKSMQKSSSLSPPPEDNSSDSSLTPPPEDNPSEVPVLTPPPSTPKAPVNTSPSPAATPSPARAHPGARERRPPVNVTPSPAATPSPARAHPGGEGAPSPLVSTPPPSTPKPPVNVTPSPAATPSPPRPLVPVSTLPHGSTPPQSTFVRRRPLTEESDSEVLAGFKKLPGGAPRPAKKRRRHSLILSESESGSDNEDETLLKSKVEEGWEEKKDMLGLLDDADVAMLKRKAAP